LKKATQRALFARLWPHPVLVSVFAGVLMLGVALLALMVWNAPPWLAVLLAATGSVVPVLGWCSASARHELSEQQLGQLIAHAPCAALLLLG
jgi:hypothetical protein